jgi:hypothetical protein
MVIIGCDYHPGFQQIAFVNTETGELEERRLAHRCSLRDMRARRNSASAPAPSQLRLSTSAGEAWASADCGSISAPLRAAAYAVGSMFFGKSENDRFRTPVSQWSTWRTPYSA